jgi:Tfp pilus assembly PilM family ATPase
MPIEEATIDIEILRENEGDNTLTVLMIASSKQIIDKVQKTIELAGLLPESIENELSASYRFISEYFSASKENNSVLFVNFGYKTTSLYVYNTLLKSIINTRNFNTGFSIFLKEISMSLNITTTQASEILKVFTTDQKTSIPIESYIRPVANEFLSEIKQFISIIEQKNKSQVSAIFFLNEAVSFPALVQLIKNDIQIPVSLFTPTKAFTQNEVLSINKNNLAFFISTIGGNLR